MLPLLKFTQNPGFIAVAIAKIAFDSKQQNLTIRRTLPLCLFLLFADPQQPIMVREEEPKQSPRDPKIQPRESNPIETGNGPSGNGLLFSPRFKSAAAMAGWDEESLLIASLVVEDTPEQDIKQKKRSVFRSKTPPTNSSRRYSANPIGKIEIIIFLVFNSSFFGVSESGEFRERARFRSQ